MCVSRDITTLPLSREVLTLLNLKPVVIITTIGKDGSINAAPYGWFSIVDYSPPQFLFSCNIKRDTYKNICKTKEFVANYPSTRLLRQIWITSKHFPYGVNELEKAGLTGFPSEKVKPPRIKECVAHIECKVLWIKPTGSASLILGSIVSISVDKEIKQAELKDKLIKLNPPLYFAFQESQGVRKWLFAEIGKIITLTEENEEIKIISELI